MNSDNGYQPHKSLRDGFQRQAEADNRHDLILFAKALVTLAVLALCVWLAVTPDGPGWAW